MKLPLTLLALSTLIHTAHAQSGSRPAIVSPGKLSYQYTTSGSRFPWLDKTINLNFKNEKPMDAIKIVLKAAGRPLDKIELDSGLPAPSISLSVRDVTAGDALAAIGRLAGSVAYVSEEDDKVLVHLRKRSTSVGQVQFITSGFSTAESVDIQKRLNRALAEARQSTTTMRPVLSNIATSSTFGSRLPEGKRVSLDGKNQDAREVLKTLLRQADVAFVLEEDVPETRHSFTFDNVSLRTALEVVCDSLGVGWGVKKSDDDKPVVHVGKKWTRRSTSRLAFPPGIMDATEGLSELSAGPGRLPEISGSGIAAFPELILPPVIL